MSDLIERQAAVDAVVEFSEELVKRVQNGLMHWTGVKATLEALPSAQPERKKGQWLEKKVEDAEGFDEVQVAKCSVCDRFHTTPYMYYFSDYNFCPNCGADMRGGDVI